jgi:hypothetical protein
MNLITGIPAMVWLIGSAIFFAFGEFLSKKFALAPSLHYVVIIVVIYTLGVLAWLPAILQKNQLSIVGSIWSVFREKLNTIGIIGIIFAVIAIALLSMA